MRIKMYRWLALIICSMLLFLAGCGQQAGPAPTDQATDTPVVTPEETPEESIKPTPEPPHSISVQIESAAVADNMLGEPSTLDVVIYLPPSYYAQPEKRFPVVYFLHGYGGPPGIMPTALLSSNMTEYEFIFVEPSGYNSLGGSFFVNSPVTGGWEDFITEEVVTYIDDNYRTIADRSGRGISGFSMGAYGALNLALRHPDLYSCMLAYSPGLIRDDGLDEAFPTWDERFLNAYGAAYSPNLEGEAPYANIPQFDGTESDQQIIDEWMSGFGDISGRIDRYIALNQPLNGIKIVVGTEDEYPWIPDGCHAFAERMEEMGLDLTLLEFDGGHTVPLQTLKEDMIDYFGENLASVQ